jgi:hypothetical protein
MSWYNEVSIKAEWDEFASLVLPGGEKEYSEIQIREMRRAFYSGFTAMIHLLVRAGEDDMMGEDETCALVNRLFEECQRFCLDMIREEGQ